MSATTFQRFLEAVRIGTKEQVQTLLDAEPVLINERDGSKNTALLWAVTRRHRLEVMRVILSRGADTEAEDSSGSTALGQAMIHGRDRAYASLLLEFGASPHTVNDRGQSLLERAVCRVGVSRLRLLLNAVGDEGLQEFLNVSVNDEGETPLGYACRMGRLSEASLYLLEGDADYTMADSKGRTPAQAARRHGKHACARLLRGYPGSLELPSVLHMARCVHEDDEQRRCGRPAPPPCYLEGRAALHQAWPQVELLPISTEAKAEGEEKNAVKRVRGGDPADQLAVQGGTGAEAGGPVEAVMRAENAGGACEAPGASSGDAAKETQGQEGLAVSHEPAHGTEAASEGGAGGGQAGEGGSGAAPSSTSGGKRKREESEEPEEGEKKKVAEGVKQKGQSDQPPTQEPGTVGSEAEGEAGEKEVGGYTNAAVSPGESKSRGLGREELSGCLLSRRPEGKGEADTGSPVEGEGAPVDIGVVPSSALGGGKRKRQETDQEVKGSSYDEKDEESRGGLSKGGDEVGAVLSYVVRDMNRELYTELLWGLKLKGEQRMMRDGQRAGGADQEDEDEEQGGDKAGAAKMQAVEQGQRQAEVVVAEEWEDEEEERVVLSFGDDGDY